VAEAGGFHITIFGVRRTGMLTNMGNPDDATALFANPAAMADHPGLEVQASVGVTFFDSHTHLQALDPIRFPSVNPPGCGMNGKAACPWPINSQGYYETDLQPTSYLGLIPYLGATQNLGAFSKKLRDVTVSLAIYSPGAYGASLPSDAPSAFFATKGLFLMGAVTGGAGWRINKYIAIGGNLSYNYMRLNFGQKFSTTDALTPDGQMPDGTARAAQIILGDLQMDYTGEDHGVGWALSTLITPTPWLGIGLLYGGWTSPTFTGPLSLIGLGTANQTPQELRGIAGTYMIKLPIALQVEQPIPPTIQTGINIKASDWVEVGFDFRTWLYSLYNKENITPIYGPEPGTPPPSLSADKLSKYKHYSNSYQACIGALVRPLRNHRQLEVMGGMGYDTSPIPDEAFSLDSPSMDQWFIGVGFRELIKGHWRVGASYEWTYYIPRNITTSMTSPPTNVRVNAIAHIPTFEISYIR
jgi:long-subunit fatty acid transport protein